MQRCMYLWHQRTSRRTGRCAEGCRSSTGLVGVVVLTLSYFIIIDVLWLQHILWEKWVKDSLPVVQFA